MPQDSVLWRQVRMSGNIWMAEQGASTVGQKLIQTCGDMVVINLPHRTDRRAEFTAQLRRIGLSFNDPKVRLFAAVRPEAPGGFPSIGARGCFMSHLGVLREALATGADSVLICEDDLDFATDLHARVDRLVADLQTTPWDMLYGFPPDAIAGEPIVPIPPERGITCTHILAFRRPAMEAAVACLEAMLTRPPGDPAGGPMHVDGAYNWMRKGNPQLRVLVANPAIGHQRASLTDIATLGWKDRLPVIRDLTQIARKLRNALHSA